MDLFEINQARKLQRLKKKTAFYMYERLTSAPSYFGYKELKRSHVHQNMWKQIFNKFPHFKNLLTFIHETF